MISVWVCFARPGAPELRVLRVPAGTTMRAAIEASGVMHACPEIDLERMRTGLYGKLRPLDTALRDRDRVEIYPALVADPKSARRKRVERERDAGDRAGRKWLGRRAQR